MSSRQTFATWKLKGSSFMSPTRADSWISTTHKRHWKKSRALAELKVNEDRAILLSNTYTRVLFPWKWENIYKEGARTPKNKNWFCRQSIFKACDMRTMPMEAKQYSPPENSDTGIPRTVSWCCWSVFWVCCCSLRALVALRVAGRRRVKFLSDAAMLNWVFWYMKLDGPNW